MTYLQMTPGQRIKRNLLRHMVVEELNCLGRYRCLNFRQVCLKIRDEYVAYCEEHQTNMYLEEWAFTDAGTLGEYSMYTQGHAYGVLCILCGRIQSGFGGRKNPMAWGLIKQAIKEEIQWEFLSLGID